MAAGVALARTGELQRMAGEAMGARPVALERERQLTVSGARLGSARAAAYRQRREERARALRFAGLEDFYRSRYVRERPGSSDSPPSWAAPRARCGGICSGSGSDQIARGRTARDGGIGRDSPDQLTLEATPPLDEAARRQIG